jgi:hypothetical protein
MIVGRDAPPIMSQILARIQRIFDLIGVQADQRSGL